MATLQVNWNILNALSVNMPGFFYEPSQYKAAQMEEIIFNGFI